MTSLLDRGDSYCVEYLGCAMLTTMATGLGVLQKPLRDLYFRHKQAGKEARLQPRHLTMTGSGISMSFRSGGPGDPPQEVFYAMPSILFWDSVQFVAVRGQDKKVRGGFEPLDNDHSQNKDKIYSVLEKKFHFLQQMSHPALFTCVLRRTSGVKALDLHAFVCSSEDEALGLVHALNMVQANYTSDEVSETGVFGYNPFGKDSVRSVAASNRSALHVAGGAHQPDTRRHFGSTSALDAIGTPQSRASIAVPPSHRGGVALPGLGGLTQADLQRSESVQSPPQAPAVRSKSYLQLTQEDFTPSPTNSLGSPGRQRSPDDDGTYEYLGHIDKSLERRIREAESQDPPPFRGSGSRNQESEFTVHEDRLSRSGSQPSRAKPGYLAKDTRSPGDSGAAKTGQGYSLLSGSGGAPPGYHGPRPQPQGPPSRDNTPQQPRRREGSPTGYQHTIARTLPRGSASLDEGYQNQEDQWNQRQYNAPEPQVSRPAALTPVQLPPRNPVSRGSSRREPPLAPSHMDMLPASQPPPHHSGAQAASEPRQNQPIRGVAEARPKDPTTPGSSSSRSMFGSSDSQSDAPSRPVAKVPPHKVQGVKVLPNMPLLPSKPSAGSLEKGASTPNARSTQPSSSSTPAKEQQASEVFGGFPLKKTPSTGRGIDSSTPPRQGSGKANKGGKPQNNWQFNSPSKPATDEYKTLKPEERAKEGDGTMNEKLLMSQKKDAEIASVVQNLQFDYEANTLSPHGTNFENALGYFP